MRELRLAAARRMTVHGEIALALFVTGCGTAVGLPRAGRSSPGPYGPGYVEYGQLAARCLTNSPLVPRGRDCCSRCCRPPPQVRRFQAAKLGAQERVCSWIRKNSGGDDVFHLNSCESSYGFYQRVPAVSQTRTCAPQPAPPKNGVVSAAQN